MLVIRDTAKENLLDDIDLDACRHIHELATSIEKRQMTGAEEAMAAVRSILANFNPRAQYADLSEATKNICTLLMRRPPGIVAMLADSGHGIVKHGDFPPTLARFTEAADKAELRVLRAAYGARRALGMRQSCIGNRE